MIRLRRLFKQFLSCWCWLRNIAKLFIPCKNVFLIYHLNICKKLTPKNHPPILVSSSFAPKFYSYPRQFLTFLNENGFLMINIFQVVNTFLQTLWRFEQKWRKRPAGTCKQRAEPWFALENRKIENQPSYEWLHYLLFCPFPLIYFMVHKVLD